MNITIFHLQVEKKLDEGFSHNRIGILKYLVGNSESLLMNNIKLITNIVILSYSEHSVITTDYNEPWL